MRAIIEGLPDRSTWRPRLGDSALRQFCLIAGLAAGIIGFASPALGACPIPNTLTNGQVADASQVMANFNALQTCSVAQAPAGSINSVQYNADGTHFGAIGPLTDGQLMIGATGNPAQAATLTAGPGIMVTNSSGAVTITAVGSGGVLPSIRGSGIQTVPSGTNFTVTWPSGTIAGDLALIFVSGSWSMSSPPTGWTLVDQKNGSNWNGAAIAKLLTSTDISAGSVTVTNVGSGDTVISIISFQGNTNGVGGLASLQSGSGVTRRTVAAPTTVAGARYIFFGSGRTSSTVTISEGTQLQSQSDGVSGSGALYQSSTHPFFGSANVNFATAPSGDYEAIVAITGP
jgi:hypothetical protein